MANRESWPSSAQDFCAIQVPHRLPLTGWWGVAKRRSGRELGCLGTPRHLVRARAAGVAGGLLGVGFSGEEAESRAVSFVLCDRLCAARRPGATSLLLGRDRGSFPQGSQAVSWTRSPKVSGCRWGGSRRPGEKAQRKRREANEGGGEPGSRGRGAAGAWEAWGGAGRGADAGPGGFRARGAPSPRPAEAPDASCLVWSEAAAAARAPPARAGLGARPQPEPRPRLARPGNTSGPGRPRPPVLREQGPDLRGPEVLGS